jgi:hypothetical protein
MIPVMNPFVMSVVSGLINKGMPKVADAVVEKGIDYVQDKMGINLKPESEMTDADVTALQERAMQHEEFMAEAQLKEMQSARDREIKLATDPNVHPLIKLVTPILALATVGFSFILFVLFFFVEITPSNKDILIYILGSLNGAMVMVLGYYFGSSMGSKDKDDKLKGGK